MLLLLISGRSIAQEPFRLWIHDEGRGEGEAMFVKETELLLLTGNQVDWDFLFNNPITYNVSNNGSIINTDTFNFTDYYYFLPINRFSILNDGKIAYSLNGVQFNEDSTFYYPNDAITVIDSDGTFTNTIMLNWLWDKDDIYSVGAKKYTDSTFLVGGIDNVSKKSYFIEVDHFANELNRWTAGDFKSSAIYFFEVMSNSEVIAFTWWNGDLLYKYYDTNMNVIWEQQVGQGYGCDNSLETQYQAFNIEEGPNGDIYIARDIAAINEHGISEGVPSVFKMNKNDGTCEWFAQLGDPHYFPIVTGIFYDSLDNSLLLATTYDEYSSATSPREVTLGVAKVNASSGDLLWYREIDMPDLKGVEYLMVPTEIQMQGDNVVVLGSLDYDAFDSLGNFTHIERDPILFYLTCDGFDSLPRAAFTSSSATDREVLFNNTSTHSSEFYWDFGDGTTSTDTFPTHQYANEGFYTVQLIVTSCEYADTITKQVYASDIGVQELNASAEVLLYPNPAADVLYISLANYLQGENYQVNVYDNIGHIVLQVRLNQMVNQLNVEKLVSGMYHININNLEGNTKTYKFIKQ